jgi:hypothetical protein
MITSMNTFSISHTTFFPFVGLTGFLFPTKPEFAHSAQWMWLEIGLILGFITENFLWHSLKVILMIVAVIIAFVFAVAIEVVARRGERSVTREYDLPPLPMGPNEPSVDYGSSRPAMNRGARGASRRGDSSRPSIGNSGTIQYLVTPV